MNILFSPIGMTDPISTFHDGAMLHICRYYDIDKVYMYMSKEVTEFHNKDGRYTYCLDKLSEQKGKNIEYELITREDLEDVHIFDTFIDEFRKIMQDIHLQNPDASIYLNVSSGTPAMKSALQVLAAFRDFDYIPIQVATPEKKSNPHVEEKVNYDAAEQWECNEDNSSPENRCTKSGNLNFLNEIKKQMLSELIAKYDYVGAKALAETMEGAIDDKFKELLDGAVYRCKLFYNKTDKIFKKYGYNVLPFVQSDIANMTEYFLQVDLRVRKGEYADFLRSLTPLFADLFEKLLKDRYKFDVNNYVSVDKRKVRKFSRDKLDKHPGLLNYLDKEYYGSFRDGSAISSDTLLLIICFFEQNDITLKNICADLRLVEEKSRNYAAHEIVAVDSDSIKKDTGFTAKDIVSKIAVVFNSTNISLPKGFLDSYDDMNKILIDALK